MKKAIRNIILKYPLTRELFFIIGKRKVSLKKIDKKIKSLNHNKIINKRVLEDCIVVLTSYGTRINELQYTLYSLITQTVKPIKIVVYIAENDFENIPLSILRFEKYGVEFHKTEDLKSYKKLLPALVEYPQYNLVTADDDLFYPKKWLENLYNEHMKYPEDVVCQQYIEITYDKNIKNFKNWIINPKSHKSLRTMCQLGGSGTLYPRNSLYKDICDYELIKELAPYSDDIWFYFMCLLNGTKIRQVSNSWKTLRYVNVYREYGIVEGKTLTQINVAGGKNDEQFRKILNHYALDDQRLIDFFERRIDKLITI
ncbi:MAG: hypothetical protein MJ181_03490 [Treponema sp.]|nr:hypothetical protein [Treponema sp.]